MEDPLYWMLALAGLVSMIFTLLPFLRESSPALFFLSTKILSPIQQSADTQSQDTPPYKLVDPSSEASVSKEAAFTRSWWTDEFLYDLERRAIFSKVTPLSCPPSIIPNETQTWLYSTHSSRFVKAGDYHTFDIAGFSLFIIMGKDKQLRAFHNVCRHRAYAITKKNCGSSLVLGCRYHGWSYDTKGALIKAPEFETIPGFKKAENGLFEIHTFVTEEGFILLNFDAQEVVPPPDLSSLRKEAQLVWVPKAVWVAEWKYENLPVSWKLAGMSLTQDM